MKNKYFSMKEIQNEEKNMLDKIIKFLDNKKIRYYIYYGTLLGAVRHKGFIPWDDDIDIIIPRPDYERLISILEVHNDINGLKGIGYELKNDYWPFIKIIDENIEISCKSKHDKNLWIDLFPIDGVPNNFFYFRYLDILKKIYFIKRSDKTNFYSPKTKGIKLVIKKAMAIILKPIKFESFINYYINYCKKYSFDDSEYVADNIWENPMKVKFKKEELIDKTYEFEDIKVNGVKDFDIVLTRLYGDYMKLPPKEKRATHSFKAWRKYEE